MFKNNYGGDGMSELKCKTLKKDLAPCPFCGGESCAEDRDQYDTTIVLFGCASCEIWCESECQWNTRAPQDEWVSVDDKLPNVGDDVLIYKSKRVFSEFHIDSCRFTKYGFERANVTHWMPLPACPTTNK